MTSRKEKHRRINQKGEKKTYKSVKYRKQREKKKTASTILTFLKVGRNNKKITK